MLQFRCAILIVYRHDFEQITVQSSVPASNFRERYPIGSVTPVAIKALRKSQRQYCYSANGTALTLLFSNVLKVENAMAERHAPGLEFRSWPLAAAGSGQHKGVLFSGNILDMLGIVRPVCRDMQPSAGF